MAKDEDTLHSRLRTSISKGTKLKYHHISTPPTRCAALYNPPSHTSPEKTFCESHSLLVTAPIASQDVAIYAIELQIYTTRKLTTIFVSKADSTGYASALRLPKSSGSLLQSITRAFVAWIVKHRHRPDRRLVVSLFARAQNQYLFPGSVENEQKHVLSDRQLVKWWCKTLDPVLREYSTPPSSDISYTKNPLSQTSNTPSDLKTTSNITSRAHLIVPAHDPYETTHFFPSTSRTDPPSQNRWTTTSPLHDLSPYPHAPPRSQVPHFPDDPKSRFLNELDDEIADVPGPPSQSQSNTFSSPRKEEKWQSPSKKGKGQWKSVKTLKQFWELMAFRQECASGRLVGFLWMVFTPDGLDEASVHAHAGGFMNKLLATKEHKSGQTMSDDRATAHQPPSTKMNQKPAHKKQPLTGPIIARQPRVKGAASALPPQRWHSPYFSIPPHTRGTLILFQKSYDRIHEILLRLDFAGLETAAASTEKWVRETAIIAGCKEREWGVSVTGEMEVAFAAVDDGVKAVSLGAGEVAPNILAVKRKPKMGDTESPAAETANAAAFAANALASSAAVPQLEHAPGVNVLTPNLVRKKRPAESASCSTADGVNLLGQGLVRKKAKT